MSFFNKVFERLVNYGTNTGALALAVVMMIIVVNVTLRLFGGIIAGSYDLIEITIVITAAFSLADCEIHKRQTVVDILTANLPNKVKLHFENFNNVISFVYWGIIAYTSLIITIDKAELGEVTDALQISIIPFRALWVCGVTLICLVIIYNTKNNIIELWRKK